MNELVAWLREQVDADDLFAREAVDHEWFSTDNYVESRDGGEVARFEIKADARHASGWSPARVLAEVAAKRRIIDRHPAIPPTPGHWSSVRTIWWCPTCSDADDGPESWPCPTIQAVASVYAGRPGWREEWAADEEVSRP